MTRAIHTAGTIHQGDIIITEELREIDIRPFFNRNLKLHLNMWLILGRVGWILRHRSQEDKILTMDRAKKIITMIEDRHEKNEKVLIVTHGAFMTVLRRELINRGYKGGSFTKPVNGKIYKFSKRRNSVTKS
nr:histidine phosphatase family protein [Paenibacillus sp. YPG26]